MPALMESAASRPAHFRWNYAMIVTEGGLSWLALTFASVSSVLPAFARELTTSQPLIGLTATIYYGGWYLPQLAFGRIITHKPRKKPTMVVALTGRLAFWVLGLTLWFQPRMPPSSALALLYACLAAWILTDSLSTLCWADIVARAIPLERRGSVMGVGQFLGGLLGIGAGVLIGVIMDAPGLPFPSNYALLFVLAAAAFTPGAFALASLREPAAPAEPDRDQSQSEGHWLRTMVDDRPFRRFIACRALVGITNMAVPFYVGHAQGVLHLPQTTIGTFVVAQTVAWVAASLGLGLLSDRRGPQLAIGVGSTAALLAPLLALGLGLIPNAALGWAYPVVFVALGISNAAVWSGFLNYLISSAPDDNRATYVGMANTVVGLLTVAPILGGWLLEASSYTVLFTVTAVAVGAGLLLSFRLRPLAPPRRERATEMG